jgi:uncharacterized SAM-binding protein YcdF (DUF218 family)
MIFWPIKLALKIISALVSVALIYFGFTFLQIWWTGQHHSTRHAQAILVFGTTENNGKPSAELKARLDQALKLWRAHRAPWMIVTGGKQPKDVYTEAGASAKYLEAHGVPAARILKGYGNDTWQNVSTVIAQLRAHKIVSVLTVTDPFHEDRAMAISSSQGLVPYPSPVKNSPTIKHSLWLYYLKETLAVGTGRLVGYGRLSSWTTGVTSVTAPLSNLVPNVG